MKRVHLRRAFVTLAALTRVDAQLLRRRSITRHRAVGDYTRVRALCALSNSNLDFSADNGDPADLLVPLRLVEQHQDRLQSHRVLHGGEYSIER